MKISELNIAVLSDVHLGHKNNRAHEIIANLMVAFPDTEATGELDIIFIAGDLFDDLLSMPHEDVVEINVWIAYLLGMCARRDIVLRILEGTPSHDWKQSYQFITMERITKSGADMRYVKDLSIEYMERFDLNVLYIPDEWNPSSAETLQQVKDLMAAKGLAQVDIAIMHGSFEYQAPWEKMKNNRSNS